MVVSWTPDGGSVLVVSQDNDGDERVRLFRVRLDAPERMEPLTEPEPNYYPQGRPVAPERPLARLRRELRRRNGRGDSRPTCLYRHDLGRANE